MGLVSSEVMHHKALSTGKFNYNCKQTWEWFSSVWLRSNKSLQTLFSAADFMGYDQATHSAIGALWYGKVTYQF
ncbi:hypothetical protein A9267_07285 [Shewanella sp. UCD-FRSSP16_17]|uniref:hypothetical protein n=1 Tax=Shewanella sp. MMG014 TaxID=2822691 RepID=UPI0007EEB1D7|nr:hypothetical protein [Shewanella sp. MMG014]MBQ4889753.1 hypothetical protein [Shewanella sp. MMG014]OBT10652.1 hypothetical protein A9267_07285 [Shewanella sp. UCD-FRSSP16_17]